MTEEAEQRLPVGLLDKLADHSDYLADAICLHLPNREHSKLSHGLNRRQHLYCYVVAIAAWRLERLLNPTCVPFHAPLSQPRNAPTDVINSLELGGAVWQLRLALDSLFVLTDWQCLSELEERPRWDDVPKQFRTLPSSAPGVLAAWLRTIARQLRAPHHIPEILLHSDSGNLFTEAVHHGVAKAEPSVALPRRQWAKIMDCSVPSVEKWLDGCGATISKTRYAIVADLSRLTPLWRRKYDEHIEAERNGRNHQ